ncbi:MAG TPA: insulinase family protein [Bryobacteraceae bacterium]|nr:insulinase family protein [Bryobacteraceae bacterium]
MARTVLAALAICAAAFAQAAQTEPPKQTTPPPSQRVKEAAKPATDTKDIPPAKSASPATKAQAPKQTPPPPGAVRPFQFPKYETKKLANGLTVFVIEDHRAPIVSYRLEIAGAGGSANDPKHAGLASVTGQLLRQGTKTRNAQQIAQTIDRTGGHLSTDAGPDTASLSASASKSNSAVAVELLADAAMNPTFPQDEIDRLRRQLLSSLQVAYNDPQSLEQFVGPRVTYGDHPYSMPGVGTPDTLRALTREDIVRFHESRYGPSQAYLAIAGDVTPAEAFAAAEKHFGSWKRTVEPLKVGAPATAGARRVVVIDKPDAVQTQFGLMQLAIPRNHPDYIPLLIANQVFGGDFNSRLNMKLRAAEGLTYGAGSGFSARVHAGTFNVGSFSRTEVTAKAISMMTGLAQELVEKPITEQELAEAKAFLAGSFVLGIETADQVAGRVLTTAINNLPPDYWNTYRERIQSATNEQVTAAVRRHVKPAAMNIIAVGNASGFAKELESYGTVQIIPFRDLDLTSPNLLRAKEAIPTSGDAKQRALELVRQAVEAHGGGKAIESVRAVRGKSKLTMSMGGQTMNVENEEMVIFPDKYRMQMTLPMGQMVQGYDGKVVWVQQGTQGREMPAEMGAEVRNGILRSGSIGLLRSALDGSAEIAATDANTILWKKGETTMRITFDPETKRVAKVAYRGMGMGGPADMEAQYRDYRKIGDVWWPHQATVLQNGQKFVEVTVTEIVLNPDLKPELFTKPAG